MEPENQNRKIQQEAVQRIQSEGGWYNRRYLAVLIGIIPGYLIHRLGGHFFPKGSVETIAIITFVIVTACAWAALNNISSKLDPESPWRFLL